MWRDLQPQGIAGVSACARVSACMCAWGAAASEGELSGGHPGSLLSTARWGAAQPAPVTGTQP